MTNLVELRDLVSLQRGQSYKSALLDQPGPILLGLGTIRRNGGFQGHNLRTYGGDSPTRMLVRPGQMYLSLKDITHAADLLGAVARLPISQPIGRLTQDTIRLDLISDRVDGDYLYWALRSPEYRRYCRALGTGTTNLDLSRDDFLAYRLRLPNIAQQRAIAEVLGALDDKIAANTKLARTADDLASQRFRALQVGAATSARLGDILQLEYGKALPATVRNPGPVAVYGSGGVVGTHDTALRNGPGVVVGRKGSVGSVYWVSEPHFPIDTTFYVDPIAGRSTSEYCYFVLTSLRLAEMNSDSAVPGLNRNEAYGAPVRVPDFAEIERFTHDAAKLFEASTQSKRESDALAATRDALLPQLMSGRLRVKDAET